MVSWTYAKMHARHSGPLFCQMPPGERWKGRSRVRRRRKETDFLINADPGFCAFLGRVFRTIVWRLQLQREGQRSLAATECNPFDYRNIRLWPEHRNRTGCSHSLPRLRDGILQDQREQLSLGFAFREMKVDPAQPYLPVTACQRPDQASSPVLNCSCAT